MNKQAKGFTVIELVFVVVIAILASVLFFVQKRNVEIMAQDSTKKTAINSMYYGLEEVFYASNKYYPRSINSENLKSVDPSLFTDPNGIKINETGSSYVYTPTNCTDSKCKSYTLKAELTNEADYVKNSRNS